MMGGILTNIVNVVPTRLLAIIIRRELFGRPTTGHCAGLMKELSDQVTSNRRLARPRNPLHQDEPFGWNDHEHQLLQMT
jgi:hypothetical protein